jgi:hypothetical protein
MSASSVQTSLYPITARGANAGSRTGFANDTFHGHTSWEMCRLPGIARVDCAIAGATRGLQSAPSSRRSRGAAPR